jgi:hypothetical protein
VVPYDSCSVQQLDGNEMVIVGGHGFPNLDDLLGNHFDWRGPDDPAGEVVQRRAAVIIADVSARFEHFKEETHGRGRVHGWMGVPLLFGERLIGMLTLDKRKHLPLKRRTLLKTHVCSTKPNACSRKPRRRVLRQIKPIKPKAPSSPQ